MQQNVTYPNSTHLIDRTRKEIAVQLIEKELSKQSSNKVAPGAVRAWMEALDDHIFWNAVEGLMGGVLLKPIVHFLTAQNYTWSKQEVLLSNIQLSSKLQQLESIDTLTTHPPKLAQISSILNTNPAEHQRQLDIVTSFDKGDDQNQYPVIIVEKQDGPMVMDGNRRCLRALLVGKTTITAWYCKTNNEPPRNFWYPIDDMMRLVKVYNTLKNTDPTIKEHTQAVLNGIFTQSPIAQQAFIDRVVGAGTPGAQDLF